MCNSLRVWLEVVVVVILTKCSLVMILWSRSCDWDFGSAHQANCFCWRFPHFQSHSALSWCTLDFKENLTGPVRRVRLGTAHLYMFIIRTFNAWLCSMTIYWLKSFHFCMIQWRRELILTSRHSMLWQQGMNLCSCCCSDNCLLCFQRAAASQNTHLHFFFSLTL